MKNGYIILGRIVDRDAGCIVLGWPNGKVTIAKRFIESVTLEAAEEQSLQELAAIRQAEAGTTPQDDLVVLPAGSQAVDLPNSLEEFMQTYKITPAKSAPPKEGTQPPDEEAGIPTGDVAGLAASGGTASPRGTEELETQVSTIGPGGDRLGEAIRDASRLISLRPPKGWILGDKKGVLQMTGEADASGFRPSLNVVLLEKGPLGPEEYAALVKEEQARSLTDYQLLQEGWRELGVEKGYEVVASGSYRGRKAVLRQCLVVKAEHLWLLSGFSVDRDPSGAFGRVEESIKTVEFVAE